MAARLGPPYRLHRPWRSDRSGPDADQSAQNYTVLNQYMPCKIGRVGENAVVTHDAIVGDMRVGHEQVVVPDGGRTVALGGPD